MKRLLTQGCIIFSALLALSQPAAADWVDSGLYLSVNQSDELAEFIFFLNTKRTSLGSGETLSFNYL